MRPLLEEVLEDELQLLLKEIHWQGWSLGLVALVWACHLLGQSGLLHKQQQVLQKLVRSHLQLLM